MLRDRKTKSGAFIDPQLAHEVGKHITILNEAEAQSQKGNQSNSFGRVWLPFSLNLMAPLEKS